MTNFETSLVEVIGALAEANEELVAAAGAGDADRLADLMRHVGALEKQRNRLLRAAGAGSVTPYETAVPMRDQVVQTLRLGDRPMSTRLLADLARARFDYVISTPKLSSLRRDEANSWKAASTGRGRTALRDFYIVPALTYDRFAPVRGTLALSSWPLIDRIIAPASPRVDMLKITKSIADECAGGPSGAPWRAPLRRLLWRLARTVSGLDAVSVEDQDAVRAAVLAELDVLETPDAHERKLAADRAGALDEYAAMFGTTTALVRSSARGA